MKPVTVILVIVMTAAASVSGAAECMRANQAEEIAEGKLAQGSFKDTAGRSERAFILSLPVPACLTGPDEFDNVKRANSIHVYASDPVVARTIKKFVGKHVLVRGRAFGAHTAHHHAPIVMDITEIDPT